MVGYEKTKKKNSQYDQKRRVDLIPLYKPYMPSLPELTNILNSGKLSYGKYGNLFEIKLSEFIGNPFFLSTNNYSNAVLVALLTLGIKAGDKVVISPLVCLATSQPIVSIGVELIFCDVDVNSGNLDSNLLREILSNYEISCVVFTHFAGIVGDIDIVKEVCKDYSVPVIEDASDAFGSKYKDEYIGNTGFDITVYSFSAVRNPNLIDAGGMTFASKKLYEKAILIRDAGINRGTFRNSFGEIDPLSNIELPGISATLDEVRSYIGLRQLESLKSIIETNIQNSARIIQSLDGLDIIKPINNSKRDHNGWVLPVLSLDKDRIFRSLYNLGITSSSVHSNISIYDINKKFKMVNAEKFLNSFLALPSGWWITDIDEYIDLLHLAIK
jgi:perosamine synthetase